MEGFNGNIDVRKIAVESFDRIWGDGAFVTLDDERQQAYIKGVSVVASVVLDSLADALEVVGVNLKYEADVDEQT